MSPIQLVSPSTYFVCGHYIYQFHHASSARAAQYHCQDVKKPGVLVRLIFELSLHRGEKAMVVLEECCQWMEFDGLSP